MELSIIIVNYNVKHFLEQCLMSVSAALQGIEAEVFVVDNASSDDSCAMVMQKFPSVKLIENHQNVGFSKANNQAIRLSTGRFVLLLNPDTVVQEDTFAKCIAFMDSHPNAGSLTVKMIDGQGNYLPESKRGFPSPMVSFFKIFGLTALFPKSETFARYYLGHLDQNSTHEIEVLPGAFMFISKNALDKAGLLDEDFFMYGEDIDLSYRIILAGFKNYYYPECQIIHYKGESTKKGSLNYVLVFYNAMIIFAKKHFKSQKVSVYIALINTAIYFRAFLSILKRIVHKFWLPAMDAFLITIGANTILRLWEFHRYNRYNAYPNESVDLLTTFYIATWVLSLWINGAYDKPQKRWAASKGILSGSVLILVVYSVLPFEMRFSRAIILFATIWSLITTQLIRLLLFKISPKTIANSNSVKKIAVVGSRSNAEDIKNILNNAGAKYIYSGNIEFSNGEFEINRLEEFIRVNRVDQIIFSTQNNSLQSIVSSMLLLSSLGKEYKIAPHEGAFIIGSNSIETANNLYTLNINAIGSQANKRNKRLFDLVASFAIVIGIPILLLIIKKPFKTWIDALHVLIGLKTWIGYKQENQPNTSLPRIKQGVFEAKLTTESVAIPGDNINLHYARNYSINLDLSILGQYLFRG